MKAERWGGFAGYDGWFQQANNAAMGVQAAYDDLVPAFERLFERSGRDFERFYAEVKALAAAHPEIFCSIGIHPHEAEPLSVKVLRETAALLDGTSEVTKWRVGMMERVSGVLGL
mgnify:CR=1 FL=1